MLQRQRRNRSRRTEQLPEAKKEAPALSTSEGLSDEASASGSPQPRFWFVLGVPVIAISLCGSREPWTAGLVVVLMSLCYVLRPPTRPVGRVLSALLLAVPALALMAFLPLPKSSRPFWRTVLEMEHGLDLGGLVTAQPWITLESWVALALGVLWLLYCLGQDFKRQEIRAAVQFFTFFIALVAAVSLGLWWFKREIPLWRGEWDTLHYYGPFPNRNHFGPLLAIGAVLALAATFDAIQRKKFAMGCVFAVCLLTIFGAMLPNKSRMGLILFFAGLILWMVFAISKKQTRAEIAIVLSFLLLLATAFILLENTALRRLQAPTTGSSITEAISSDGRVGIYQDAFRMIGLAPWTGVGLGNFEPVFSMTRKSIDTESRARHPESDWLWLASEAGIPCVLCALLATVLLAVAYGPWNKRRMMTSRSRRLSLTLGVAALMFPLQSLVDTPLHGIGPATLAALLVGLARPVRNEETEGESVRTSAIWPGLGMGVGALGASLLVASLAGSDVTPRARFDHLAREAKELRRSGDRAAALQTWGKAASLKPLQWNIYFERAVLKLELGYASQVALADFSRARYLEQTFGRMCMSEVEAWMQYDPPYAIPALREAMTRDASRAYWFYVWTTEQLTSRPELRPALRSLAATPSLQFVYLSASYGVEFESALKEFLAKRPTLEGMKPADRLKLFELWYARGTPSEVVQHLEVSPEWLRDGWPVLAAHRAKQDDFAGASMLAREHLPEPPLRPRDTKESSENLRRLFLLNPQDPLAGMDLYWSQKSAGDREGALATLREVSLLKDAPAGVFWELAEMLTESGDHLHAWDAWQEYSRRIAPAS